MYSDGTPEKPVEKCDECNELVSHKSEHWYSCSYSDETPPWARTSNITSSTNN